MIVSITKLQDHCNANCKFINRMAMGRVWFTFYTGFVIFFLVLSVIRHKLPLSQILNHPTYDVYSPKAVETLIHGQCYNIVFFIVCKVYFLLVLLKRWIQRE